MATVTHTKHDKGSTFTYTCDQCGKGIVHHTGQHGCGTGYATTEEGKHICYECCGVNDRQAMLDDGKITLYLTYREVTSDNERAHRHIRTIKGMMPVRYRVTNWPNSLSFECLSVNKGSHNIAGSRYDAYFVGPDGHIWHGVNYGENSQLCHCKRTKQKA